MKKRIGLFFVLIFAVVAFVISCSDVQKTESEADATDSDIVDDGSAKENTVTWTLDEDHTLTVFGNGEMSDYEEFSPWDDYTIAVIDEEGNEKVRHITPRSLVVEEGVTCIGVNAFSNLSLKSVSLPNSLKTIKSGAFANCISLEEIKLPAGVSEISPDAFDGCDALKIVVAPENQCYFADENGVIYNKDKTIVVFSPAGVQRENDINEENESDAETVSEDISTPYNLKYDRFEITAFYIEGSDSYRDEEQRFVYVDGECVVRIGDECAEIDICRASESINFDNFFNVVFGAESGSVTYDYRLNTMYDDAPKTAVLSEGEWLLCANWGGDLYLFKIVVNG